MPQNTRAEFDAQVTQLLDNPASWPIDFRDVGTLFRYLMTACLFKSEDTVSQANVAGLIVRLNRLEQLAGGAGSETAGLQIFEDIQDDIGILLIKQNTSVVTNAGRRFRALQDLSRTGGLFPVPTGLEDDEDWEELPIGGQGYNPRVNIGQVAFRATIGSWSEDKLYRLFREKRDGPRGSPIQVLPDVYVYTISPNQISPYAIKVELDGKVKGGSYDVEEDEFTEGGGGGGVFPADAPRTAQAWLNLPAGSVIASRPLVDVTLQALSEPETFPGYAQPSAGLNAGGQPADVERGTTITPTLTPSWAQGDAGALTAYQLKRGATVLASDTTPPIEYPALVDSYQIGLETIVYQAAFSYAQGVQKEGSQGTPAPGRINAGTVTAQASVRGLLNIFYGPTATASTTSAAVRALPTRRFTTDGNSFLLNTGTTQTVFEIVAPDSLTVSVIDLDALNAPMPYTATALSVNDAAGTPAGYKVWRLTIADPYSSSHRHQVTLS